MDNNNHSLYKYSRALAESILSLVVSAGVISSKDIDSLSSELLNAYEKDGKIYGDSEEGFLRYLRDTKIIDIK